uniref:Uncharacterized conserved protein, contains HEPN domain n=1 Tax=Candidatus Kentrum sp. FM TaxID=2126340 RepID=A0A450S239_9GAMM|nr:MAG: Uncharacterized conserved protein, contains HEPN domain [Candidatus Kentron sp. FM]VFJ46316.1 MAG: Uncharacterized conserved protein, contains HEPN domain [Candidatus Kentron sp. FM]VFK07292.1 MAG: Uncharacterized conserved protein, contains HEPN domain [Candidatus Kentron sp. FM]
MSERGDDDFLRDIRESMERIVRYTRGMEYEDFFEDDKTQDAVIRNLEIMGEATKALSEEFRNEYADIPWKKIAMTRDKLIHHYFGVNTDIVWNIAKTEIPKLLPVITNILQDSNGS